MLFLVRSAVRTKPPDKSMIFKVRLATLVFTIVATTFCAVKARDSFGGGAVYRGWLEWLPVALFILSAVGGAWALIMSIRLAEWRKECHKNKTCAECGYDIRASPERCPECGTSVLPK